MKFFLLLWAFGGGLLITLAIFLLWLGLYPVNMSRRTGRTKSVHPTEVV